MVGFIPVHYIEEMGDWLGVCGAEDGYQAWDRDDVTCQACIDELNGVETEGTPEDDYSEEASP